MRLFSWRDGPLQRCPWLPVFVVAAVLGVWYYLAVQERSKLADREAGVMHKRGLGPPAVTPDGPGES